MATRASIQFVNKEGQTLVTIYKHYDGYPSGLGQDILDIISNKPLTKGINPKQPKLGESFNGFGCLVVSFISLMKDAVGDIYIEPQSRFGKMNENYLYIVQEQSDGGSVKIYVDGSQGSRPPVCLETLLGKIVN